MYPSLSSRRAWIEIASFAWVMPLLVVALLTESVDRNFYSHAEGVGQSGSLSSRRAWIEMPSR